MFEYKREYSIPKWATRPSISVLIPVYNHSKYLSKSIQSILKQQDLTDWCAKLSIKVLNDGSTEPVKECLKEYLDANLISYKEKKNDYYFTTVLKKYNIKQRFLLIIIALAIKHCQYF